jgi:hypothetical protein
MWFWLWQSFLAVLMAITFGVCYANHAPLVSLLLLAFSTIVYEWVAIAAFRAWRRECIRP